MSVLRIAFLSSAVLEFFAALGVAGVAVYIGLTYLGFLDVRWSPLTLQAGLFCLLMAPEVYAPLRQFAAHYHDRATALAAVTQIAVLFDGLPQDDAAKPTPTGRGTVVPSASEAGAPVEVTGLRVTAPGRGQLVLAGAALRLAPGEQVALMGPSGIGKSTLIEAIARLRPFEGDVRIDGVPLGDGAYNNYNGLTINRALISENMDGAELAVGIGSLGTPSTSNLGGTISYTSDRPAQELGGRVVQTFGSDANRRTFVRVDSGEYNGFSGYVSGMNAVSDLWNDQTAYNKSTTKQFNAKGRLLLPVQG
ncbi:hypothetical protein G6F22_014313 [Rhizopus arrhizus]|nr:hypothetical protein G6F22_014313 [Rhizopus arrhizus]